MFYAETLYNLTVAQGTFIRILEGLMGFLVMANLVMLFSILVKNRKAAMLFSLLAILLIQAGSGSADASLYFQPSNFISTDMFTLHFFVGGKAVSYMLVIPAALGYMAVSAGLAGLCHKRYRIC